MENYFLLLGQFYSEAFRKADWCLGNHQMRGFFRVTYDAKNWNRLIRQLRSKHEVGVQQYFAVIHICYKVFFDYTWLVSNDNISEIMYYKKNRSFKVSLYSRTFLERNVLTLRG